MCFIYFILKNIFQCRVAADIVFFMLILPYNTNIHLNTHIHTDLEHPMPCSVPTQCSVSSYSLGLVLSSSCLIDAELRTAFAPRFFFFKAMNQT